ncbi:vacuolar protein sorting-associated protein Vps17 [Aspergillus sclerotioniger CBS 115572]|uniref:Vacuolar protein sorting-associated protein 17 n=1 Tax=Aspergillus sclerotioniger CBS 115572 TaxID=1450535 RepID=A0A317WHH2_9EURO|nr:vacuolar protein sorting-associated protein Vps17 [Aspergillus sclerotioniger CBS 115572]PWY85823.1 vacuolar protein sorting-associated protein Vps17 [Aspergillus sclerotioniger CBS 115572]
MDYSALSHDPDHPAGTSPWASPRPTQTTFPASVTGDIPPAPLPPQDHSPYNSAAESQPTEGPESQENENDSRDLSERLQSAQLGEAGYAGEQPPYTTQQQPQYGQQPRSQLPARYQTGPRQNARQPAPVYKIQAKVTGLERTGKKDPILRFDVHTNIPKFRTTQYRDVRRTHGEFVKLADHLISANPETFVPAVPSPLTPAGAGTEEDEIRVKSSLQRWLNVVLSNDVLTHDDEVVLFVESDFGYSPVVRMKQPATGVRRKVLKQFAPPPDDTPELQNARPTVKMFYLGTMDTSHKVDRVVKARRGLGLAESDFGVKLGQMHVQETHPGLSNAYRKLGKIIQTVGDFHAVQATAEATTLGDPLSYHSSDAFIVKETLTNRHILLRELIQAQQATRSKRAAADRLKVSSSVRPDKVDEAINALDEAQSHEDYLAKRTQRVTSNLLSEKQRWFARTSSDMLASLREYTMRQIEAERRTLATLESVRPDIRAIDASGGLSRLGRESHPAARRPNLGSSQGPKGDAWSGIPRRSDSLGRSLSGSFVAPSPTEDDDEVNGQGNGKGRLRSASGVSSIVEEDDDDRLDARNAASRLATSTF